MSLSHLSELFKEGPVARTLVVLVSVMLGYVFGQMGSRAVQRGLGKTLDLHQVMIAKRLAFYGIMILAILTGLNEAGINLSVLVGAAGVASVAIGFASQTTMSNLISGIFMLIERPFMVGDLIKVGSTSGEITSMGLFSTILKTPENMMVRIPNETLMKSEITNMTRFPIRRLDLPFSVGYSADLSKVRNLILDTLMMLPLTKKDAPVLVLFKSFGEFSVNLNANFAVDRDSINDAGNAAAEAIQLALTKAGFEVPNPHRTIHLDSAALGKLEISK